MSRERSVKWVHWPTLQEELADHVEVLQGKVLNAGCGERPIALPHATSVVNMDLALFEGVDVVGDLESIPFEEESFDGILNVAVLEHVRRPWVVVRELQRILKKGGVLLCVVPFFQPIHYVPTDYYRFTPEGITSLLEDAGFCIERSWATHTMWHTWGWMIEDLLRGKPRAFQLALSPLAALTRLLSRCRRKSPPSFPNAITVVARKR